MFCSGPATGELVDCFPILAVCCCFGQMATENRFCCVREEDFAFCRKLPGTSPKNVINRQEFNPEKQYSRINMNVALTLT